MKVYSIQTPDFVEDARRKGFFTPQKNKSILLDEKEDIPFFDVCYRWMMDQYHTRIGKLDEHYPLWVWKKRPDLRRGAHGPKGDPMVLLTLEIPEEQILFSYFHPYNMMLNDVSYALFIEDNPHQKDEDDENLAQILEKYDLMFSEDGLRRWANSLEMTLDDEEDFLMQGIVHAVPFSAVTSERPFIAR